MKVKMDKPITVPEEFKKHRQVGLAEERCYDLAATICLLDDMPGMPFNELSHIYEEIMGVCESNGIVVADHYGEDEVRNCLVIRYNAELQVLRHTLAVATEELL